MDAPETESGDGCDRDKLFRDELCRVEMGSHSSCKCSTSSIERFPAAYREAMSLPEDAVVGTADDPYCLAMLKHYRSLMPMAMEARKPMFFLKPADGAIGAHVRDRKSVV